MGVARMGRWIVLFGGSHIGRIAFIEVKAPGGKVRKIQQVRHRQLRNMGFKVFVLDDPNYIPMIIEEIKATAKE